MALKKPPGIIPALDTNLGQSLINMYQLKGLSEEITGLKIGGKIIDNYGLIISRSLFNDVEITFPWILDPQKRGTDIPDIIREQVADSKKYGAIAYIASPLGAGSNESMDEKKIGSLQAFVSSCKKLEIEPIIVLEMTQPGASYFLREGASEELAKLSYELGVRHFVAPANRPERIEVYRRIIGKDAAIISPGVGPQATGNVIEDAINAIKAGADHLVIGRGIYQAQNPKKTTQRIYEAILKAYQTR